MAVGGDDGLVDTVDVLHKIADLGAVLLGQAVAGGVGDVHHGGTRFDDGLDDAGKVFVVGASGILGIELHVFHEFLRVFHSGYTTLDDFFAGGVELIFNMVVAGTDAGVDALVAGILEGFDGNIDVLLYGAGEGADGGPRHGFGYLNDGVEIAWAGDGESGFDDIHTKALQLLGHLDFFYRVELATGHLFTVAEGGVEDIKFIVHDGVYGFMSLWGCKGTDYSSFFKENRWRNSFWAADGRCSPRPSSRRKHRPCGMQ